MRRVRALFLRLAGFFSKQHRARDIDAELRSHLHLHIEENLRAGMSLEQARRHALLKLGGLEQTKQDYLGRRSLPMLETLLQDLKFALRMLQKNPGFSLVAVLTLALGIGANTAIFSLVNGVLLLPLPYANPSRLVATTSDYPKGAFAVMRDLSPSMDFAANTDATELNLTGLDSPERLTGSAVSANWFSVLSVHPEMGRTFHPGEDQPGKDGVVILSYSLWQRRFGRDPNIIGRAIELEGQSREIVGVMPPTFTYPSPKTELWIPLDLDPRKAGDYWGASYMSVLARLRPGVSLDRARAEFAALRPKVVAAFAWRMPDDSFINSTVMPLQNLLVFDVKPKLIILLGAVGLLLLIACANVANLLLARATTRQREIAVRTALGAGRGRIIRQLTTESVLLAVLGGGLGLLVAYYGLSILKTTLPADTPRLASVAVDARVLVFTAILAVLTGLLFGVMPAAGSSKVDLVDALKTAGAKGQSAKSNRLSRALIIGEVSVAAILVIGAGLLVKSLWNLSNSNQGYRPQSILTARITPDESFCDNAGRCQAFYNELLSSVRALPGVTAAAASDGLPLSGIWQTIPSDIDGYTIKPGAHVPMLMERVISPEYLQLMSIPLLQGRAFTVADSAPNSQRVVLVAKSTAERFWPGKNPIGEQIKPRWLNPWWTVVGVVGDVKEDTMTTNHPDWIDGEMYVPYGPHSIAGRGPEAPPAAMTLLVRSSADTTQLAAEIRGVVAALNPTVPVSQVQTLPGWISAAVAGPRSTASLFSIFAALALLLGAAGIYGVISYFVAQRTREIGIRLALGARRKEVLLMIVGQSARLALLGVGIGLIGALLLTRLMGSLLYGVAASDPLTYAIVAVLLLIVALAASYVPARRAMRVDPVVALRYE
ncbi:MAG TPA: ABC transporter permease [Candidatus Methylomirabilis sp.]|nr:ABC transporter permease [Candidatus Methylomirabilis sp.]